MVSKSFSSLFLTLGVLAPVAAVVPSTACSSKFEGCSSSRSCPSDAGEGGDGGTGGKGGKGGGSGSGGSAGKGDAGAGGTAGKGDMGMGGESGETGASGGKAGSGGKGGSGGSGGVAGTGGSAGSPVAPMGGEGGTGPEPDETAPTILSVTPNDDATGVAGDAVITITFSEPMDRATAEAAYQSADIPAAATTRRWNSDDTVLTITPNDDLAYAEGTKDDIAFLAKKYALEMTDTAEDVAGNRLVAKAWSFSTLRRVTQVLVADGDDVRRINGSGNYACTNLDLGDYRTNETLAGFVQFDLSGLAPGIMKYEVADFYGTRVDSVGDPRSLDGVHLWEVEGDITELTLMPPFGPDLGVFLDSFTLTPSLSILPAMTSNFASDGLIQLRLKVVPDSDGDDQDDYYRLTCAFELGLKYLAP